MNDHRGPFTTSHTQQICGMCEYLRTRTLRHGTFSNDYQHYCMNPALVNPELPAAIQAKELERGRYIGTEDETPKWCPFLQSNAPMIGGNPE
jgi:hypothetical protein